MPQKPVPEMKTVKLKSLSKITSNTIYMFTSQKLCKVKLDSICILLAERCHLDNHLSEYPTYYQVKEKSRTN